MIQLDPIFLMYSFRYALGRRSYAVSDVARALIEHRHEIRKDWRDQCIRDINEAIEGDTAGMKMDHDEWRKVIQAFQEIE